MVDDTRRALNDSLTATDLDGSCAKFWCRAGKCHLLRGEYLASRKAYARGLELDAGNKTAADHVETAKRALQDHSAAEVSFKAGKWKACLTTVNRLLDITPSAPSVLLWKARCLLGLRDLDTVGEIVRTVLQKTPESPDALCIFGTWLCVTKKDPSAGLTRFKEALRLDPKHVECLEAVEISTSLSKFKVEGNDKFKAGKTKEAVAMYSKALELDPSDRFGSRAVLLSNRASAGAKLGQVDQAIDDCSQVSMPTASFPWRMRFSGQGSLWGLTWMGGLAPRLLSDKLFLCHAPRL